MSSALSILEHAREADNHEDGKKMIYFAAGIDGRGDLPNLLWVVKNFPGQKICLLHVLQPSRLTPALGYARGIERKTVQANLKKYHRLLRDNGLEGEEVYIKMEKVEEGIVKLIFQHGIQNLVMGAAAREMVYIESKVTKYVSDKGSMLCQIWFVHKGHLIKTRYEKLITEGGISMSESFKESLAFGKAEKESNEAACKALPNAENLPNENMQLIKENEIADATAIRITSSELVNMCKDGTMDDELYEQLKQAMVESTNAKAEAHEESLRRQKAEKDIVDAARRAEAAEKIYNEEMTVRKERQDAILMHKQKLKNMSSQLVSLMEELNSALKKKSLLEGEIDESKKNDKELKEKIISSVQMLLSCRNEQDELKIARDSAFRAAEVLRQQAESTMSIASLPQFLSEYSYSEIASGTCYFHPSLKIDERGSRSIYKGILHHTEVAIKMLFGDSLKGPSEYKLEVDALIRLRHPNIVTLIGVCPEALAIIYEHLPNGSLEDRLNCKDNSPPLTWQTRIRIAFELCSVLIFLHSSKPQGFVHGALNPSNILLDDNFTSKLSHFGTCCAITTMDSTLKYYVNSLGNVLKRLIMQRTADEGFRESHGISPFASCTYMDPESIITRETTPQHDVYSFGKIILRLLTGKEVWGVTRKVQCALNDRTLSTLLDCSAGDWPYLQAQQLAHIAVRCTDMNRGNRPHLESEVLELLRAMKESCQGSSTTSPPVGCQSSQPPPYIVCPIYQDVMQYPNVAADGFTYEAEAIQEWINSGHDTSPMTNLKLPHTNLVPNHALKSLIQRWRRHHQSPLYPTITK